MPEQRGAAIEARRRAWLLPLLVTLALVVAGDALRSARFAAPFSRPVAALRSEPVDAGARWDSIAGVVTLAASAGRRSLTTLLLEWETRPGGWHLVSLRVRGGVISAEVVPRAPLRPPESRVVPAGEERVSLLLRPSRPFEGGARLALTNLSRVPVVIEGLEVRRVGIAFGALRVATLVGLVAAIVWTISCLPGAGARGAAIAFVLAFALYRVAWVPDLDNGSDNFWYVPTAHSLLREGDAELSEFSSVQQFQPSYKLVEVGDRRYNLFPIGVSLAIAPFVSYADWRAREQVDPASRWLESAAWLADLLAAATVGLLSPLALRLAGEARLAAAVTACFAVATPQLAIHAGGLWSHCVTAALLVAALLLVEAGRSPRGAALAGVLAGLAMLSRPTAVVGVALAAVAAARRSRAHGLAMLAGLAPVGLLFVVWSQRTFGTALPQYGRKNTALWSPSEAAEGLAGVLWSPNRGLLVFCPLVLLSLVGAVVAVRDPRWRGSTTTLLGPACAAYWVLVGSYVVWWGGGSYGPRLFGEVLPFLALLWIPALSWLRARWRGGAVARVVLGSLGVLALAWSVLAAWQGAFQPATRDWNRGPGQVTRGDTSRLWDWGDLQMLRGIAPEPTPLRQRR